MMSHGKSGRTGWSWWLESKGSREGWGYGDGLLNQRVWADDLAAFLSCRLAHFYL